MKFLLLCFCLCVVGCKTHQVILDQGGDLPYKETKFVRAGVENENSSADILKPIQRRLDFLERNSANKQELDEAIESLKKDIQSVRDQMDQLKNNFPKKVKLQKSKKQKDLFAEAEKNFKEKKWKDAILNYEKFRTEKPQSSDFKRATLKIGKSFIELGYPQEAQVFFEEVIARFPNSSEAQEAQKSLAQKK